jgi:hypothetical protein
MQVTWHGYPNTTGLSTVHYRISDALVDPLEEEAPLLTGTGLGTGADSGTDVRNVTGMQQWSEEVCVCVCVCVCVSFASHLSLLRRLECVPSLECVLSLEFVLSLDSNVLSH